MTLRERLQPFLQVTIAALLNLVVYIVLYAIWGALINEIQNPLISNTILSVLVCAGYACCLFFITYLRHGRGEVKVQADYRDTKYTAWRDDLQLFLRRERWQLILIAAIILLRAFLVELDHLLFGKLFFAHVMFPYVAMNFMGTVIPVPFIGDIVSVILIEVFYAFLCLRHRRKIYHYWMGNDHKGENA